MSLSTKQVFKPVLDNPFINQQWPQVDDKLGQDIVDLLARLISPISHKSSVPPPIASSVTIGFNSTVKALERQAKSKRDKIYSRSVKNTEETPKDSIELKYVFVAKTEIKPDVLTLSFPVLSFTASPSLTDRIKLIPLPKGSMNKLSQASGRENTGIVGLKDGVPGAKAIYDLAKRIEDVDMPWLNGLFDEDSVFYKPALKVLATTAPIRGKKGKKNTNEKNQNEKNKDSNDKIKNEKNQQNKNEKNEKNKSKKEVDNKNEKTVNANQKRSKNDSNSNKRTKTN